MEAFEVGRIYVALEHICEEYNNIEFIARDLIYIFFPHGPC